METKTRQDVETKDRWKVEAFYPSFNVWEEEFKQLNHDTPLPRWKELASLKGKLSEGARTLKNGLDLYFDASRKISKLYTYAHLRHDEDIANEKHKTGFNKALALYYGFKQESSWIVPEILALPEETLKSYLEEELLSDYHFYLETLCRLRPHTLAEEQEALIAHAARSLTTAQKAFSALNDADFKFGSVKDAEGKERPLSHASYGLYMSGTDRTLRKNAFFKFMGTYTDYENTLCELLHGQMQAHHFESSARHYSTCLEAALYPNNIDTDVYHNLISTVKSNLSPLHEYVTLRKELLGVEAIHAYDVNAQIVKEVEFKLSYEEAASLVIDSVAPLGEEYQEILRKGLTQEGWVDRYENKNKRSGAYSSGCYDSSPFILMNYKNIMRDLFTLAHEAGHSMHTYYSDKHQPFQYSQYPIFLAEVASTFNEELLFNLLLERTKEPEKRRYLIAQKLQDLQSTFFRQTLFAEFELFLHTCVEKEIPLTPQILKEKFRELYPTYYGPSFATDEILAVEWSRIPHFYYNFYVYQYATGISAALALHDQVMKGGKEAYLNFLKMGCSGYPLDLLKTAGVDMRTPAPVVTTIRKFQTLTKALASHTKS